MRQTLAILLLLLVVSASGFRVSRVSRVSMPLKGLFSADQPATQYPKGSLSELCQITHDACDILAPMIKAFYNKMSESSSTNQKLKADASYFTIVDGIVQELIVKSLFKGNKFLQIVGEEDESNVNIVNKPFTVDELQVPPEFNDIVEKTRDKIAKLSEKIDPTAYKLLTAFVDPIDGTREFATGKGEFCSTLIGYNDAVGKPVAGIIYRPLTNPPTWAAGAKSENCALGNLDKAKVPVPNGVLVTDGKASAWLGKVIELAGLEKVPAFASGNRALMLIEGKAGSYIRDTGGFSKWDTSGPQAVIEAYGGVMAKLPKFLSNKALESYTYIKSNRNLDFENNVVTLTLSNARNKKELKLLPEDAMADDVDLIKEYACVMGLVALDKENLATKDKLHAALVQAQAIFPPLYT